MTTPDDSPGPGTGPGTQARTRIVAVVPAYNEAERIAATVQALQTFCDEVFVIDDGSTDTTASLAIAAGARVLKLPRNRGKGAAMAAGIAAVHEEPDPVVILADGDLASSASALRVLVAPVLDGLADLVIAAPPAGKPSGVGLVESLARTGIKILTGAVFTRPLSGQRAMRASTASRLGFASGFGAETAMTIDALRAGLRVHEVACDFTHKRTERDLAGFTHRGRQGVHVLVVLARRSLRSCSRQGIVRK